jgi:S1-C subfamily serine protease
VRAGKVIVFLIIIAVVVLYAGVPAHAQDLKDLEKEYLKIVRAVRPMVVRIHFSTSNRTQHGGFSTEYLFQASATGVIVDSEGTIVALESGIKPNSQVMVSIEDMEPKSAKVLGVDNLTGISVLKLDNCSVTPAPIGDSDKVEPGQFIVAVGNAFGLPGTVYYGSVVGTGRTLIGARYTYSDMIQISTPVFPGDPGGLIADSSGNVIGIISKVYLSRPRASAEEARARMRERMRRRREAARRGNAPEKKDQKKPEEKNKPGEAPQTPKEEDRDKEKDESDLRLTEDFASRDANFALPINFVMKIVEKVKEHGCVPRPLLGVTIGEGVQVTHVIKNSPADKAGIKRLDIITQFNSEKVSRLHELKMCILKCELGGKAKLTIQRGKEELEIKVELFMEKKDIKPDSQKAGEEDRPGEKKKENNSKP